MQATTIKTYSREEYLDREQQADYKSEYIDGEIVPMAGGTTNHNQIALNMATELNFAVKKLDYRVYMGDVRLWIPEKRIFTYPDLMLIHEEPIYYENRQDTILNPTLIIEVLSPSTQDYDREGKFAAYRTISSFQEYVLISQTKIYAEKFVKTGDKQGLFQEFSREDRQITLQSLDMPLSFSDIYNKVQIPD
jgi:Uma2 family endonuclease